MPGKKGTSKKNTSRVGEPIHAADHPVLSVPGRAHLIRIPDTEARRRAIMVLGQVKGHYCGFTDFRMLVTNEHLQVLNREAIPYEVLS